MKVPAAMLAPILPLSSSLAAAIAFTAVYGLLSPWGYAYFGIWKVSCCDISQQVQVPLMWDTATAASSS